MTVTLLLPFVAFWVCLGLVVSRASGRAALRARTRAEWGIDLVNLAVQGWAVPLGAGWLGRAVLTPILPAGGLHLGLAGGFLLAFVGVDALYYANHRLLHRLWPVHRVHHSAAAMDVWVTSRNTVWATALVVYPWAHGLFLYLLDTPDGYLLGASATAALDLWRHSGVDMRVPALVTPRHHAWHHSQSHSHLNYGANWMIWDHLFGTAHDPGHMPSALGLATGLSPLRQLLWPFGARS